MKIDTDVFWAFQLKTLGNKYNFQKKVFFFLPETIPVKIRVQFTSFHKVSLIPGYSWAYLYGHFEFWQH